VRRFNAKLTDHPNDFGATVLEAALTAMAALAHGLALELAPPSAAWHAPDWAGAFGR